MKGFTLIETLVAVTILALAIAGPFYAIRGAVSNSIAARDQLVAASLGQEAIEYIRSVRDGNYLSGDPWMTGLGSCQPGPCAVDPTQGTVSTTIAPLRLSSGGLYTQQTSIGDEVTRFTRSVEIVTLSANEVRITATVTWQSGVATFTTTLVENLRDWL